MADQFDKAQETDALIAEDARARQALKAASEPKLGSIGECWNDACGEPLEHPRLFCGPKCAEAHAKQRK